MRNIWSVTRFSFAYNAKRKSTWIYFGIISVLFFGLIIALMKTAPSDLDVPASAIPFSGLYLVITSLIFALLLGGFIAKIAATTFVDGEQDGTTLLVVSRKYTRMDVILGRFLTLLIWILIYSFTTLISVLIPSLVVDGSKNLGENFLYSFSVFFGAFFISMFLVSIALLAAIAFGKVGTIVITTTFAVLIPVVSLVLTTVSQANEAYDKIVTGKYSERDIFGITADKADDKAEMYSILPEKVYIQNEDIIHNSYEKTAWADIWGQTSSTFGMFMPSSVFGTNAIKISHRDVSDSLFDKFYTRINRQSRDGFMNFKPYIANYYDITEKVAKDAIGSLSGITKKVDDAKAVIEKSLITNSNHNLYDGTWYLTTIQQIIEINESNSIAFASAQPKIVYTNEDGLNVDGNLILTPLVKSSTPYNNGQVTDVQVKDIIKNEYISYLAFKDALNLTSSNAVADSDAVISSLTTQYPVSQGYVNFIDKSSTIDIYKDGGKNIKIQFSDQNGQPSIDALKSFLSEGISNDYEVAPYVPKAFTLSFWPILIIGLFGVSFLIHTKKDFK